MSTVFISYAREDTEIAEQLSATLADCGIDAFRDVKDIAVGLPVVPWVQQNLEDCVAVVVLISIDSRNSSWVPFEIGYAAALHKYILPLVINPESIPDYLRHLNFATSVQEIREQLSTVILKEELSEEINQAFMHLLQSVTFDGCHIDDSIWIKHGWDIVRSEKSVMEKLHYLRNAKNKNEVHLPKEHNYDLIYLLFNSERVGEYWATADQVELHTNKYEKYIYDYPNQFGDRFRRVYIVDNVNIFRNLHHDKKQALRDQIKAGVGLRYFVSQHKKPIRNIAIYGEVAYGVLEKDRSNKVSFNHNHVLHERELFRRLWRECTPLTKEHLITLERKQH